MTRKEVCKATGLSVKTLRLYEEKGLIGPARERRNGREYREYTQELVEQLKQIVILRRALFTMDEIKTMQEHPDAIPGIFRDYQAWLEGQERQFHLLRQAAEKISEQDLGSLEGLLSGLENAAEQLPLPAMDVKPNFKRLDQMEEEPRHVTQQVNFDEMVPDAKVFRQMNIVMDGDRANNINIALGQLNATRDSFSQARSGVVQRERKLPKWQRITRRILTALVVVFLLLFALLSNLTRAYVYWPLVLGGILLAARIVMSAVPAFLEHRAWLKKAQREDAARQGMDMEGYRQEEQAHRKRTRNIILLVCAGGVVLSAAFFGLYKLIDSQVNAVPDYTVCILAPARFSDQDIYKFQTAIAPLVGDLDGNGKETVKMDQYRKEITRNAIGNTGSRDMTEWFDNAYLRQDNDYPLLFVANFAYGHCLNLCEELRFDRYCRELPEDIASPENSYLADLGGAKIYKDAGLEALPLCACIPNYATEEEYDFAVALLREILGQ